jgi:hypothetical protein
VTESRTGAGIKVCSSDLVVLKFKSSTTPLFLRGRGKRIPLCERGKRIRKIPLQQRGKG